MLSPATPVEEIREYSAPILRQRRISWRGGAAEALERGHSEQGEIHFSSNSHALFFAQPANTQVQTWYCGKFWHSGDAWPKMFSFLPAGSDIFSIYSNAQDETVRYLALFIEPEFMLASVDAAARPGLDLNETFGEGDALSWQLANAIEAECKAGAPHGSLYAETMAAALSLQVLRHHSNLAQILRCAKPGGMPDAALRRVTDYMLANISQDITLTALAAMCGLPPVDFLRAFQTSTGQKPHVWLRGARLNRAQELLMNTNLPVSQIARSCGFGSSGALNAAFRYMLATTPGAWRRVRRG